MSDYRVRLATLDDAQTLVSQRLAMFEDMGIALDRAAVGEAFGRWLQTEMPGGYFRAWVVETDTAVVAGGGITIIPWPPGPRYESDRLAFVYSVYTEPGHRHRGLARQIMNAIHAWCRQEGITSLALNASRSGRPLYEGLGYTVTENPMMFLALD